MSRRIFWALAIAIALLLPWEAWHLYPLAETDSLWFLPAAVHYSIGGHLFNHLHPPAQNFDATGTELFVFYPPGLPWLLGILAPEHSPRGVFLVLALLNSATVLMSARLIEGALRRQQAVSRAAAYRFGSAALLCLATYASSFCLGRPDFLATFLLLAGWGALVKTPPRHHWIWAGLCLGLVVFTQPVAGLLASAVFGAWCAVRLDARRVALATFPAYGLGVAVLVLLLAANPNGFDCIVTGVERHARATLVHGTGAEFWKYFLIQSYATGYGLLFLAVAALLGLAVARGRLAPRSPAWFVCHLAAGVVLFFHFVAIAWDRFYNVWTFVPFLLLALCAFGFDWVRGQPVPARRAALAAGGALLLLGSIGFLQRTALFIVSLREQPTYLQARAEVAELLAGRAPGRIGVSKSLWVLFDDYHDVRSFSIHPSDLCKPPRYLFVQQRYGDRHQAPQFPGYTLRRDDFSPQSARLLGVPLSPTPPSYRFAFYEKDAAP